MNTMNHNINDLLEDAKTVYYATDKATKVAIASKYGINATKAADIMKALYKMANDLHKDRTTFVAEDYMAFRRLWDGPESPAKIRAAMADESDAFVIFYRDTYAKGRRIPTRSGMSVINTLDAIIAERYAAGDTTRQALTKKIEDQIADFKAMFFEARKKAGEFRFNYQKEHFGSIEPTMAAVIAAFGDHGYKVNGANFEKVRKARVLTHNFDLEAFMEDVQKDAEFEWKGSIHLIVTRIMSAGLDGDKIQISRIADGDAKAFDIHITDGTRSMHARSIFAAEFSTIVTPHFRFIITNE